MNKFLTSTDTQTHPALQPANSAGFRLGYYILTPSELLILKNTLKYRVATAPLTSFITLTIKT